MMKLFTREEVMELLSISRSTLIRWENKGILQPVKLPETRTVLFEREDIMRLIKESKQNAKAKDKKQR